jgi:hypothetical protein
MNKLIQFDEEDSFKTSFRKKFKEQKFDRVDRKKDKKKSKRFKHRRPEDDLLGIHEQMLPGVR